MSKMKAVFLQGYGGPEQLSVNEADIPSPGAQEVRIRIAAAAINTFELKLRKGFMNEWMPLEFPAVLGGDVAGIVDAVGENVSRFAVGDRVAGMIDATSNGSYAQYTVANEAALARVPDNLDLEEAAALLTGTVTGTQMVEQVIAPKPGSTLLVTGAAGSVGRAAVIAALDAGATVYAGVRAGSATSLDGLPAAKIVDLSDEAAIASHAPYDAVADAVGGSVAESLFRHIATSGILASAAVPPPTAPAGSAVNLVPFIVSPTADLIERILNDAAARNVKTPIAHRLPLEKASDAHALMENGNVGGKILLVPAD